MTNTGKFKVAVVGIGTDRAKKFLPELFYSQFAKLVAVCDPDSKTLKRTCESFMINGYRNYEELLENEEIDFAILTIQKAM